MKISNTLVLCFVSCSVFSQTSTLDLVEEVNESIDGQCELSIQAGAAFHNLSNELVSTVNQRISAILDAYQLDCLSSLLALDIPLFDFNLNLDFCEIARDQILGGGGTGFNAGPAATSSSFEHDASTILKRHQQTQDLLKQLGESDG